MGRSDEAQLGKVAFADYESNDNDDTDDRTEKRPQSITGKTLEILNDLKQPMTAAEIWQVFLKEGFNTIKQESIRSTANFLYQTGRIKRLAEGVYAYLEYDEQQYEPRSIGDKLVKLLNDNGEPMHVSEINDWLNGHNEGLTLEKIRERLAPLCKQGKIQRISQSIYACSSFDGSKCRNIETTSHRLLQVINNDDRPMDYEKILQLLNEDSYTAISLSRTKSCLFELNRSGQIKRLAPGIYANSNYNERHYKGQRTITSRIIEILDTYGGALESSDIARRLIENGSTAINRSEICTHLSALNKRGKIKRLAKGVYASLSYDERGYEAPKAINEVVLEFIESYERPVLMTEIIVKLVGDNYGKAKANRVRSTVAYLCRNKKIKRLDKGVYAPAKFTGSYVHQSPIRRPNPKERQKATASSGNVKKESSGNRKELPSLKNPAANANPESSQDRNDNILKQAQRSKMLTVGARVAKIINNQIGPTNADAVIRILNVDGFRRVNPETVRPLIETRLRRKQEASMALKNKK